MKILDHSNTSARVSIFDNDAGLGRLRVPGDGGAIIGISLPGSGDR